MNESLTLTLPINEQAAWVIVTALGIAATSFLVWLTLGEQSKPQRKPLSLLIAFGWVLVPVWLILLSGTLWQLWLMMTGVENQLKGSGLGTGALVAAMLGAPFVIWGTVLKQRTVDFQKEGHITDRITSAVEQLGAEKTVKKLVGGSTQETTEPNIEVRIGAILSLERIAQDSTRYDNGRDHVRVMEILCAYVRENSNATAPQESLRQKWNRMTNSTGPNDPPLTAEQFLAQEVGDPASELNDHISVEAQTLWATMLPKPRADVAQAIQVLGRRTSQQLRVEAAWPNLPDQNTIWPFDIPCPILPETNDGRTRTKDEIKKYTSRLSEWEQAVRYYSGYRLDLRGANLQGAALLKGTFCGAIFNVARMEGADLRMVRLEGADLRFTQIVGADLCMAQLDGANLSDARIEGTDLRLAKLKVADLNHAQMENSILRSAQIAGANLSHAQMENADFRLARMEGAYLRLARMEGADLKGAHMEGAYLSGAWMDNTDLRAARLDGSFLGAAWIRKGNLEKAVMTGAMLGRAKMDADTILNATLLQLGALRFVDLRYVPMKQEQANSMFGDASVALPESMLRPDHWPDWELPFEGENEFFVHWRKWQADPAGFKPPPKPE